MIRVTWFLSHPIQYISPLLKELAARSILKVYYYSDASIKGNKDKDFGIPVKWDIDLLKDYDYHFVKNYSGTRPLSNGFLDVFNPGVVKILRNENRTVVIVNGWSYSSDLMVILFSRIFRREIWLRAESPLNQELKKSRFVLFLKKLFLKKLLFKIFIDKCLYIGADNKLFFEYYGVQPSRLIYTPYAVDNSYFAAKAVALERKRDDIKMKVGLQPEKKIILFSGKYIPKKNPMDLLKAFQLLKQERYALVMVGEGRMRKEMELFILENHLQEIYLTGFVNQSEISDYYSIADVFVMCSGMGETWGLAVNEAMNFGKPVIVSSTCGCSLDLVKHGQNGFVFAEGNIKLLADYIKEVLENDSFRISAGNRSKEIIKQFSIDRIVDNICENLVV